MGITSPEEYVEFFLGLGTGGQVGLLSLVNNERMALRQRLGYRGVDREGVERGLSVLEALAREIAESGEDAVIGRYGRRRAGGPWDPPRGRAKTVK